VTFIRTRFLLSAVLVSMAAFILGPGPLLPDQSAPRTPRDGRPVSPRRSGDDGGFSILLSRPRDSYLVGRQPIEVDPTVPSGDEIAQVDFFVNNLLVATDLAAPFAAEVDFGQEIRRHAILVRAVTRAGRRAAVSFISRAASLAEAAAQPIASVPVRVTTAEGKPVGGMSVSDFSLMENGVRQPIVHFDRDPGPLSIHFLLHAPGAPPAARGALIGHAAAIAMTLPAYHSLAFSEAGAAPPPRPRPRAPDGAAARSAERKPDAPPIPTEPFLYDRAALTARLAATADSPPARPRPLDQAIAEATAGLMARPRGRVLILLLARPPVPIGPPDPEIDPSGAPPTGGLFVDPALEAAFADLKQSGAAFYLVDHAGDNPPDPVLETLVAETGGASQSIRTPEELGPAVERIADLLLDLYLISYAPPHPERGGWRKIAVAARAADLVITARSAIYLEAAP
jgi:hypothetical protein